MPSHPSSLGWLASAGLAPPVLEHLLLLEKQLWTDTLEPPLLELVRLRVAQLLEAPAEVARRSPAAVAAGFAESKALALSAWRHSTAFNEREQAVLAWTEHWVIDPEQITDADAARLRRSLTDQDCASLSTALALFEALARTRLALGLATSGVN